MLESTLEFTETWTNCLLRSAVLESNLLEKGSIKLWLQLLIPVFVDNVSDFLFPTDMWWTVGIALQSLSSTNVYYCLPHQKAKCSPADYHPINQRYDHVKFSSGSLDFYPEQSSV